MIHGVIQDGVIVPLRPLPAEWVEGREVVIDVAPEAETDNPAEIEKWHAEMQQGGLRFEPGEREAFENILADADLVTTDRDFDAVDGLRTESWGPR